MRSVHERVGGTADAGSEQRPLGGKHRLHAFHMHFTQTKKNVQLYK